MAITGKQLADKAEIAYQQKWGYIWATAGETWTEKKQDALNQKYYSDPSKYADFAQGVQYGKKWFGHKVADCSGLVTFALPQLFSPSLTPLIAKFPDLHEPVFCKCSLQAKTSTCSSPPLSARN